ncbi:MAG: YhgE/Pip domain-containing protein [Oscillospiraceae bacterium]|nr:YhgE/Pip domain-containing protein [Oscillospiraceae bacterium]
MKNILSIFTDDLTSIAKHFFAFIIAIALCVIPALYAWFNIFSNWDPYGGTGYISIALVTRDRGYTMPDGEVRNEGRAIVDEMAAGTSINWVPADYTEAMEGVRAGRYYGALILGENLSRNMYNLTEALYDQKPSITFVQNAKTNAIANKITETAASTAEHNIQLRYLGILIENLFNRIDETVGDLDTEENMNELIRLMKKLEEKLEEYCELIDALQRKNIEMGGNLHAAGDNIAQVSLQDKIDNLEGAKASVLTTQYTLLQPVWEIQRKLAEEQEALQNGANLSYEHLQQLIDSNNEVLRNLALMEAGLPKENRSATVVAALAAMEQLETKLKQINDACKAAQEVIAAGATPERENELRWGLINMLGGARNLVHNLELSIERICKNMTEDLETLQTIMTSLNITIHEIPPVMYAADGTLYALNGTLKQVGDLLSDLRDEVKTLTERLEEAKDDKTIESLIEMLHGDPEEFAVFLSNPVEVETVGIYPVNSYGTAMTPFYSTLALWVGCVVLAAVIKVEADGRRLKNATHAELYWGRFLTYSFFGQIQSFIIIWGDMHLLGVECSHPLLFYLAGAVTSFVFVCLIYSMVLTFGDVGKAVVVVVMILQIAGSSGSYPIEILPEIFSKVYLFFPYPYAINAMREAICGLYRYDYLIYLGQLLVFGVLGLFVGLVLRMPFHGVNEFVEEEMHESGVL